MLKQLSLLLLIAMPGVFSLQGKAQGYKHGVGLQLNTYTFKASYTDDTGVHNQLSNLIMPGLVYKAALGIYVTKTRALTISLASYPFVGFNLNSKAGGSFGAGLPLLAEFFLGDVDYFGGFLGVGGSYSYTQIEGFGDGVVVGPQIEGGIQFPLAERVVALRLAYTYGVNRPAVNKFKDRTYMKSKRNLISIGLTYVFGY